MLRAFDPHADRMYELFKPYLEGKQFCFDRQQELRAIALESVTEQVAVLCRSKDLASACAEHVASDLAFHHFNWLNLSDAREAAPFDRIVVPNWLDRMSMRELLNTGYASKLDLVLLPFERKWLDRMIAAGRKWENRLERASSSRLKKLADRVINERKAPLWSDQVNERLQNSEPAVESSDNDNSEIEELQARAILGLQKQISHCEVGRHTAKARLILLDDYSSYVLLPPTGRVIVLSRDPNEHDKAALERGQAEGLLFRAVASLEPGMVLAFSAGDSRDLVDARADQYLQTPEAVRRYADMWRQALRQSASTNSEMSKISASLTAAGQPRSVSTVRAWVTQTHTLAPMNYRNVIPLIAELTGNAELKANSGRVLQSIDLIYRARVRAAEAIVTELSSGQLSIDAEDISFQIEGRTVQYKLHRIASVAGVQEVPLELIGRVAAIDDRSTRIEGRVA